MNNTVGFCKNCRERIKHNQKWERDKRDGIIHSDCKIYQDMEELIKLIDGKRKQQLKQTQEMKTREFKYREERVGGS